MLYLLLALVLIFCWTGSSEMLQTQQTKCNIAHLNLWLEAATLYVDLTTAKNTLSRNELKVMVGPSKYGGLGIITASTLGASIKEMDSVLRIPMALSISFDSVASPAGVIKSTLRHGDPQPTASPPPAYQRYQRPYGAILAFKKHYGGVPTHSLLTLALMAEEFLHAASRLTAIDNQEGLNVLEGVSISPFGPWLDCLPQLLDLPHLDLWSAKIHALSEGIEEGSRAQFVKDWSAAIEAKMIEMAEPWADHRSGKSSLTKTSDFRHITNHFEDTHREFKMVRDSKLHYIATCSPQPKSALTPLLAALQDSLIEHVLCIVEVSRQHAHNNTLFDGSDLAENSYFEDVEETPKIDMETFTRSAVDINKECNGVVWDRQDDVLVMKRGQRDAFPQLRKQLNELFKAKFTATAYVRAATLHASRAWNLKGQQYLVPISDFFNYAPSPKKGHAGKVIMERNSFFDRSSDFLSHHQLKSSMFMLNEALLARITQELNDHLRLKKASVSIAREVAQMIGYLVSTRKDEDELSSKGRLLDPRKPPGVAIQHFEVLSDRSLVSNIGHSPQELHESYGDSNNGIYFRYHGFAPATNPFECTTISSFSVYRVGHYRQESSAPEHLIAQRIGNLLQRSNGFCLYNATIYSGAGTRDEGELDPVLQVWSVGAAIYHGEKISSNQNLETNQSELEVTLKSAFVQNSIKDLPSPLSQLFSHVVDCTHKLLPQLDGAKSHKHFSKWYDNWKQLCLSSDGGELTLVAEQVLSQLGEATDTSKPELLANISKWLRLSFQQIQLELHRQLLLNSFKDQFSSSSVDNDVQALQQRFGLTKTISSTIPSPSKGAMDSDTKRQLTELAPIPSQLAQASEESHLPFQMLSLQTEASFLEYRIPKKNIFRSHLATLRVKSQRIQKLLNKTAATIMSFFSANTTKPGFSDKANDEL